MKGFSRRLLSGSKGFIGGAVAAVLVTASAGQANHIGFLDLGHDNTANDGTLVIGNVPSNPIFRAVNNSGAAGLRGESTTGNGTVGSSTGGTGVLGQSATGVGVSGKHTDHAGTVPGVQGDTASTAANASGVLGRVTSSLPGSFSAAVRGDNAGTLGFGIGVWGSQAGTGWGVYGSTASGVGVFGKSANTGVRGEGGTYGGYFLGTNTGVYAKSTTGPAMSVNAPANTAPMTVNSDTKVTNLHADKLDGYEGDQLFTSARMATRDEFDMVEDGDVTVTLTNVPPGAYVITGKASVELMEVVNNGSIPVWCTVAAGGDSDQSLVDLAHGGGEYRMFLIEILTHTFASMGSITLTCHEFGLYRVRIHQAKLMAIKVGSETHGAVTG